MDLLIKNAVVVKADEIFKSDIGIDNGKFCTFSSINEKDAKKVIDAEGKYVLPGVIDVHTHLEQKCGDIYTCDNFEDGTMAAAFGGTTTIVNFAVQERGESVLQCLKNKKQSADNDVYIDYSLHAAFTDVNVNTIAEIPDILSFGVNSIKVYMTYSKEKLMVEDGYLYELIKKGKEYGVLVGVHAENDSIIEYASSSLVNSGKTSMKFYKYSRPVIAETEAIGRVIDFCKELDSSIYIYHLSTEKGLLKIKQAQEEGFNIFTETCPHYLLLDESIYNEPEANNYLMSPPLRSEADKQALWQGINKGTIKIISTDHCPFTKEQKNQVANDFTKIPAGIPGIELLLPLIFSEGVQNNKISLQKMVKVLSTNPAKIFGLTNKGSITIGKDADFVIVDPKKDVELTSTNLHMKSGYTLFEGKKLKGYPITTAVRGQILVEDGKFIGKKGYGQFIKRDKISL
ncbi:dihydropyrimidinase [Clostridium sp. DJ247]|uniref:dihydropyrimidinase n=1 Tax=Clostridium sp. DJ247 TaxID=2726188 RepID=UPI0016275AE4|nr:dihydropyrimidinase [Clostridium sp. DJ247]MBC2579756.1 dihydropyrimidinase [Clostridium sp. DJ247]